MKSIIRRSDTDLIRIDVAHRPIPYFKNGMEIGVFVEPAIVEGLQPGDFVRLYFATVVEGTRAAREYDAFLQRRGRRGTAPARYRPHVWFGYELFRIEVIPDDQYWKKYGPVGGGHSDHN